MNGYLLIASFVISYFFICLLLTRITYEFFKKINWMSKNYQGQDVVHSFGILIIIHYLIYFLFVQVLHHLSEVSLTSATVEQAVYVLGIALISLMGFIDDRFGQSEIKGLRGHWRAFIVERKLTSGLLKAVVGSLVAMLSTYSFSSSLIHWFWQTVLVMLSIHVFNLLDLRPGRSIKSFWLGVIFFIPFFPRVEFIIYVLPIIFSTLLIFRYERCHLSMLGDAGSNVLGFVYGYNLLNLGQTAIQLSFLLLFLVLSLLAEKVSFSEYIKKTPWLSKLDNWGIHQPTLKD